MKGFKDKDNKFHPTDNKITSSVSVKDARNSSFDKLADAGVEHIKQQKMTKEKSNDYDIRGEYFDLDIEDGKITNLSLDDNFSWRWSGNEDSANGFLIRVAKSEAREEFLEKADEEGLPFELFKKQIKENLSGDILDNEDGIYEITGDNTNWKFGEGDDQFGLGSPDLQENYFDGEDFNDEQQEKIMDLAQDLDEGYQYEDYLKQHGKDVRKEILEQLDGADSFEDYFDSITDESFRQGILEQLYLEGHEASAFHAINKARTELENDEEFKKLGNDEET